MLFKLWLTLDLLLASILYGYAWGANHQIPLDAAESEEPATVNPPDCISPEWITDWLLYKASMSQFLEKKEACWHNKELIWDDDGCTHAPDHPLGLNFTPACQRHDFGYRNYGEQSRCTEKNRHAIDKKFLCDLRDICDHEPPQHQFGCNILAKRYYVAVDEFGEGHCANGNIPCGKPGTPWCRDDDRETSGCGAWALSS